jgi:hypothetical protein
LLPSKCLVSDGEAVVARFLDSDSLDVGFSEISDIDLASGADAWS